MKRSLVLRRESLSELSDVDLSGLAGAGPDSVPRSITCAVRDCLDSVDFSRLLTCVCDSLWCT